MILTKHVRRADKNVSEEIDQCLLNTLKSIVDNSLSERIFSTRYDPVGINYVYNLLIRSHAILCGEYTYECSVVSKVIHP